MMTTDSPTPFPTLYPYVERDRHLIMISAECISLANRLIIGSICCWRLCDYRRRGVLRWGETKAQFHAAMLCTVPFFAPLFTFCLFNYDQWQCSLDADDPKPLYELWARTYAIYRMGLILQLFCVSIMVVTWSRFLSWTEVLQQPGVASGEQGVHQYKSSTHLRLMRWVWALNVLNLLGSVGLNGLSLVDPDRDLPEHSDHEATAYSKMMCVNWIFLDIVQLCLALFLVNRGRAMLTRIRATGVLDARSQSDVVVKVNLCLSLVVTCLLVEIGCRILITIPEMNKSFRDDRPQPSYAIWRFLEEQPLLWQFCGYILPYDVVSFCLLYLMRAPPTKKPATFRVTIGNPNDGLDLDVDQGFAHTDSGLTSPLVPPGQSDFEEDLEYDLHDGNDAEVGGLGGGVGHGVGGRGGGGGGGGGGVGRHDPRFSSSSTNSTNSTISTTSSYGIGGNAGQGGLEKGGFGGGRGRGRSEQRPPETPGGYSSSPASSFSKVSHVSSASARSASTGSTYESIALTGDDESTTTDRHK